MDIYDPIGIALNLIPLHNLDFSIEEMHKELIKECSPKQKGVKDTKNGFYGLKHSEETLQKLRKPKSTTLGMRKPKSEEHRKKILASQNWKHRDYSIKETCVYCGLKAMKTNITRFHNEKCKLKKEIL